MESWNNLGFEENTYTFTTYFEDGKEVSTTQKCVTKWKYTFHYLAGKKAFLVLNKIFVSTSVVTHLNQKKKKRASFPITELLNYVQSSAKAE